MKSLFILIAFYLFSCGVNKPEEVQAGYRPVGETEPVEIKLAKPFDSADYEYSGLAVFNDNVVLLPQYLFGFAQDTTGYIYTIKFSRIDAYLSGENRIPIKPDSIKIFGNGLQRFNHRGSGYEAIAFMGNFVFLAIEDIGEPTNTFLVKGRYDENANFIRLDASTLTELPRQCDVRNYGYETLVKCNNELITISELNGKNITASPRCYQYDLQPEKTKSYYLPHIEYRITDATYCENNIFWAINYFWPGDIDLINPAVDRIAEKYGMGEHQSITKGIERILKFEITNDSLKVAGEPIYIKPDSEGSSNWEGIAKFGNGFLLITDSYPETRFVFVNDNK